jgi:hypothetical protein
MRKSKQTNKQAAEGVVQEPAKIERKKEVQVFTAVWRSRVKTTNTNDRWTRAGSYLDFKKLQ